MLVHMTKHRGAAPGRSEAGFSCRAPAVRGSKVFRKHGAAGGAQKIGSLISEVVCARTSVVLTSQKSLFPERKSRSRLPMGPTPICPVGVTIGAATGNTEVEEVMNEFERRDEGCLRHQPKTYSDPAVVAVFAKMEELQPCEEPIFQRWIRPGATVLDLGVGVGRTAGPLSKIASCYIGLDYSQGMVEACRARYPQLEVHHGDATI